ncbi:hypothetical protein FHX81_5951 [Saccharothrix saharensis]|uniref:Uncharacterized protein n=1 Tax=Saccharothrix saharensis TaxID=571190 RepID=A0A543JL24_9PSEU|nr:hypothetical protein [Saccharothrix saharensis]TQM83525.1 hypothetical protein FHX81_5951 [Saccharothrix saharensis]
MTTALRLPDPFTPDTTTATPTWCCCRCRCAVPAVGGAIALPASLFLPWVLASPFLDVGERRPFYALAGAVGALLRACFAAEPGRGVKRLAVGMALFAAEPVPALPVLGLPARLGEPFAIRGYGAAVAVVAWLVVRHYAWRWA